jgi:hypothetical protein
MPATAPTNARRVLDARINESYRLLLHRYRAGALP